MNELDYKTRKNTLDKRVDKIVSKVNEMQSGNIGHIEVEDFKKLQREIKWAKNEIEDIMIDIEVEDFLAFGPGRSREGPYDQ